MSFLLPRPRRKAVGNYAPRLPFGLNNNSPQAKYLKIWYPGFNPLSTINQIPGGYNGTFGSAVEGNSWRPTQHKQIGFAQNANENEYIEWAAPDPLAGKSRWMVTVWVHQISVPSGSPAWISSWSSNAAATILLRINGGELDGFFSTGSALRQVASASADPVAGETAFLALSHDDATFAMHKNGVQVASLANTESVNATPTNTLSLGGQSRQGGEIPTDAIMWDFRVYDEYNSAILRAIYDPPTRWDLFQQATPNFLPVGAVAGLIPGSLAMMGMGI